MFVQSIIDRFVHLLLHGRQIYELLRPAVNLAPLEVHDAATQRLVGGILVGRLDSRVDIEPAGVGFVAVLCVHQLANRLGYVLRMDAHRVRAGFQFQRLLLCGLCLCHCNESVFLHAVDDVQLSATRPFRVANRVVGTRRFGQAGQHGGLRDRDVPERFVEISFAGRRKTISALAQENLVHVDLEDLVFGQQMLKFERQQNLVDLARIGLFGRQVDVARDLHGDGRTTLAAHVAQVGQRGPYHALVVDPAVFIEPRVFTCQHGIGHDLGYVFEACQVAALFTELAQQHTFGRKHTQRKNWTVVGQVGDIGQIRERHRQRNPDNDPHRHRASEQQPHRPKDYPQRHRECGVPTTWGTRGGGVAFGRLNSGHRVLVRPRQHCKNARVTGVLARSHTGQMLPAAWSVDAACAAAIETMTVCFWQRLDSLK